MEKCYFSFLYQLVSKQPLACSRSGVTACFCKEFKAVLNTQAVRLQALQERTTVDIVPVFKEHIKIC